VDSHGTVFQIQTEPEVLTSVRQCSNITFDYWDSIGANLVANPPPTAPYNVVVYAAGMEPLLVPMNNSGMLNKFGAGVAAQYVSRY
jgi:hypothetical protein